MVASVQIAPSLLAANFINLGEALEQVGTADLLHVDVMDGHFVPNLTLGPMVVQAVRKATALPIDVHLMIADPDRYLEDFRRAGADSMTVHWEAVTHLERTIARIHELGALAGVAINPATPVEFLVDIWEALDVVLIMSVNPGFGGQTFLERTLDKIERMHRLRGEWARPLIEVDGGIAPSTAQRVVAAGADILVAGSAIFGTPDPKGALENLRASCVTNASPRV